MEKNLIRYIIKYVNEDVKSGKISKEDKKIVLRGYLLVNGVNLNVKSHNRS